MAPASPPGDDLGVLANLWPLFGLTVQTSRLKLRLPHEQEIAELASIAGRGVHHPGERPFLTPGLPETRRTGLASSSRSTGVSSARCEWIATGDQRNITMSIYRTMREVAPVALLVLVHSTGAGSCAARPSAAA
jgi:hypothetical protein